MKADRPKRTNTKLADRWAHLGRLRWVLILMALLVGAGAFVSLRSSSGGTSNPSEGPGIFTVKRGDLTISVTESGDVKPINSIDIMSEVEGETTLISIVDEGTYITPEDVNNGKILAELDSSKIKDDLTKQEIDFLTARADYTDANEALQIQKKQNESDIQTGEMNFRFALMDLQKYLGDGTAAKLIAQAASTTGGYTEIASFINDANSDPNLRCEAIQMLRQLEDNIKLADMKLARAKDKLEGTRKLYEKEYVAEIELKADELEKESLEIQKKQAETAKDLFIKYEFPKEAETRLSGYYEAERELDRIKARARSMLAQAEAKLESEKATYSLETERLQKWRRQLEACTIRAPAPGQVVYASSMMGRFERRRRMVEVGAEIDERQKIISIPDLSQMKVEVKIHETWVGKIQPDQGAKITFSALPDQTFNGKVLKKAPLPDPEDFLNPDLKVYTTDVSIEGTHESLKTGMTAKAEIIIDELHDVLSVPIQSVINVEGKKICFVATGKGTQRREVETGAFNDSFVEIKSGLAEGEKVMLNPPRLTELGKTRNKELHNK
ncbi:MAG: efflux RND transporter periplasmic adaptor subunit [Planctomycetota bacterium]